MDNLNLNQKVIDSHSKNQKECLVELQKKTNQIFLIFTSSRTIQII